MMEEIINGLRIKWLGGWVAVGLGGAHDTTTTRAEGRGAGRPTNSQPGRPRYGWWKGY